MDANKLPAFERYAVSVWSSIISWQAKTDMFYGAYRLAFTEDGYHSERVETLEFLTNLSMYRGTLG